MRVNVFSGPTNVFAIKMDPFFKKHFLGRRMDYHAHSFEDDQDVVLWDTLNSIDEELHFVIRNGD